MFNNKEEFKDAFQKRLTSYFGVDVADASQQELYKALGSLVREHISGIWKETNDRYRSQKVKQVYYLSLEFLLGRLLGSNILNLGLYQLVKEGLADLDVDLDEIEEAEPDAGLGNGGLGRLAACFLDSLASLELPGHGCGIRYKYGLFEQKIINGYQVELPDNWLKEGNTWEVRKSDKAVEVKFGGSVTSEQVGERLAFKHVNYESAWAVPYDMPVVGYDNQTVNTLRLFSAEIMEHNIDIQGISTHNQKKFIEYKRNVEAISEFLYPDDSHDEGRKLRLKQQYFLVSAALRTIIRTYLKSNQSLADFPQKVAIHINDTHPVLAIPELMRILMDEEYYSWDDAWQITCQTISYTNHTTLSEALETWSVDLMKPLLPRVFMIIEEINRRFTSELWQANPGNWDMLRNMEIIQHGVVRMANLAIVGSYSVNGVARVHTEIIKNREMKYFNIYYPNKFNNKTNGITHRRWLIKANPQLASTISEAIGEEWITEPSQLKKLDEFAKDQAFKDKIRKIKHKNKERLAQLIKAECGTIVDTHSIFDVQIKRLHAYKRQVMNVLQIMDLYNQIKDNPDVDIYPRTFIFGAKAAPSYYFAKKVIKLINTVAQVINNDKSIDDKIKIVFLENYRVSSAEIIIPATDVSEQISTASKEASGTGNMKFMMNGAITMGTLDGANIEIEEEVGDDNIFIFGLTPNEVLNYHKVGGYSAWDMYNTHPRIRKVLQQLIEGPFANIAVELQDIHHALLAENDEYFVLKDFMPYVDAQLKAGQAFKDRQKWSEMAIHNIAGSGRFSSDRTIREYATDIWGI